jgi:hypothetical protein
MDDVLELDCQECGAKTVLDRERQRALSDKLKTPAQAVVVECKFCHRFQFVLALRPARAHRVPEVRGVSLSRAKRLAPHLM